MIATLKDFLAQLVEPGLRAGAASSGRALQVATAALLLEMMRADDAVSAVERNSVAAALRSRFGLADAELSTLLDLAAREAGEATGYHQFTSLINKACSAEQKVGVIENLWQIAFADDHLAAHEEHLLRKIADLLYVPHAEYVAAKQRARAAAGSGTA